MTYKKVSLNITQAQLRKAAAGKVITLSAPQLAGSGHSLHLHPSSYEKVLKAKKANRGVRLQICRGEIDHDLANGGSLFSWLKGAAKDTVGFVKDNWKIIRPIVSKIADVAIPALAAATGQPELVLGRPLLRSLTGIGLNGKLVKGSQAAKDRMMAIRSSKRRGGSFRLE